jgi:hypothetical protein
MAPLRIGGPGICRRPCFRAAPWKAEITAAASSTSHHIVPGVPSGPEVRTRKISDETEMRPPPPAEIVSSVPPGVRDMATSCRRWNGGNTAALRTTVSVLTTRDVTERPRRMNSPYFPPPVVNLCRSSVAVPLRHPQGQRPDGDQSDTMAGGKWRPSWRLFNSTPSAPRRLRPQ